MSLSAYPKRALTEEELATYQQDGVVMVKGLVEDNWLRLAEAGLEGARRQLSPLGVDMSDPDSGYETDLFMWKQVDELRDLIYYAPFARWAQQIMGSSEVRFFYDQMFIKEVGANTPTPWHHDMTFWPLEGMQMCSFWIPFDPVSKNSSSLQYVKGSHRWPQRFKAISPDYNEVLLAEEGMDDVPDINADPDRYDAVCWDMEPGDALIFHPLTLHGSAGNTSRSHRRRALALRWMGDDVTYHPSPTRMLFPFTHSSTEGGKVQGASFPIILPAHDPAERATRATGPEDVDFESLAEGLQARAESAEKLAGRGFDKSALEQTW
ncbi:MAG: phytanoyl-CoA dioxygenase family protein [Pseudomonadota bacterium]